MQNLNIQMCKLKQMKGEKRKNSHKQATKQSKIY